MDKSKINMIIVALLLAVGVWWFFLRGPSEAAPADGGAGDPAGGDTPEATTGGSDPE